MPLEIELADLDLHYEGYRMKSPVQERKLLVSIQERGIEMPLQGVDLDDKRVLLDGFKRRRCAKKLGIGAAPYVSLGSDEATGILTVLRGANEKSLSILEQAQFIDDLVQQHKMSNMEIAETLSRSKSWVAMRLGLAREMKGPVGEKILGGSFPIYSYMYTLRPIMRMNGVAKAEVEAFVGAMSGKKLSVREIGHLANGYFRGPQWFREEIDNGHLKIALDRINEALDPADGCSRFEAAVLREIEALAKNMQRLVIKSQGQRLSTPTRTFCAQAGLLLVGILSRESTFRQAMGEFHDRLEEA
jgi:hypothetical protein